MHTHIVFSFLHLGHTTAIIIPFLLFLSLSLLRSKVLVSCCCLAEPCFGFLAVQIAEHLESHIRFLRALEYYAFLSCVAVIADICYESDCRVNTAACKGIVIVALDYLTYSLADTVEEQFTLSGQQPFLLIQVVHITGIQSVVWIAFGITLDVRANPLEEDHYAATCTLLPIT